MLAPEYFNFATDVFDHWAEIEFVSELPKTISGKTRRVALRDHDQFVNK